MCGICAVLYNNNNNGFDIFQALISIQHRGQDGAGIYYCNDNFEKNIKKSGLICDIFNHDQLNAMNAHTYLAHTRYKTNSIYNSFQPFNFSHDNITIKTNKKKKENLSISPSVIMVILLILTILFLFFLINSIIILIPPYLIVLY